MSAVAVGVLALAGAALVVLVLAGFVARAWRAGAELALTFLLAAGVAGLTGAPSWAAVTTVAALVGLEALVHRKALRRPGVTRG